MGDGFISVLKVMKIILCTKIPKGAELIERAMEPSELNKVNSPTKIRTSQHTGPGTYYGKRFECVLCESHDGILFTQPFEKLKMSCACGLDTHG